MICLLFLPCILQVYGTNSLSPSFSTEEVPDHDNDFKPLRDITAIYNTNLTKCVSIGKDLHLANINSVKLTSDGRFLNATVYLTNPFVYSPNSTIYRNDTTSVDVELQSINSSVTVADLLDDAINRSHDANNYYRDIKPIEHRTFVTKNGYQAFILIYQKVGKDTITMPSIEPDTKNALIGIKNGDKVLLLKFSTLASLYSSYLDDINTIVDSIRLSPINQSNMHIRDNFTLYNTPANNLSFVYPSDWEQQQNNKFLSKYHYLHDSDNTSLIATYEKPNIDLDLSDEFYYMLIDVHSTFDQGPDYAVAYHWNNAFGWAKSEAELSKNGYFRDLYNSGPNIFEKPYYHTYQTSFHDLSMNFDLQKANFPKEYSVYIYKQNRFIVDGVSCYLVDVTGWIPIPPPKFSISASPDTLELRPNEEKIVKIKIHNNSTSNANFMIYPTTDPELNMTLNPHGISLLPNGESDMNLKIRNISNNTEEPLSHTISLTLNATFPQNTPLIAQNVTLNDTEGTITSQVYYYTVTTLPKLELKDYLDNLAGWVSPLNSIWAFLAAVGAVLIPFLLRIYSKRRQTDNIRRADEK
jgi:hypothetical protein